MQPTSGTAHLAAIIAAHLREWEPGPAHVELAIHTTDDATTIAQTIDAACRSALGAAVAEGLFYQSSIGSVSGVRLDDGRAVVIKAHQPERPREFLDEIARVQRHLWRRGVFAPEILAGPIPLGRGFALIERFVATGATAEAHDPEIRAALARGLHTIVAACEPLVATTSLGPHFGGLPTDALWPTPHSKLFDFAATTAGAEWIDEVATLARRRFAPAGRRVIGHGDWRQEHVRFVGREPVAAFDWDSLCCDFEPALVGSAAHGFCADWSVSRRQEPTLDEARDFVDAYAAARGSPFTPDERRLCGAAFAFAVAYTARCGHSAGADQRDVEGSFHHLIWTQGANLLAL
jgi:hypothetical protein